MKAEALSSGLIVAGRFRLDQLLGEGGMAAVWSAQHVVTKRRVAIKVLKTTNPELVQRFMREARAANAVEHPNIVQVHDVFELEPGRPAMVMDLFEGESLGSLLERRGALPLAELPPLFAPVVSAMRAIHAAGIVHRDLKPHNVFMARRADGAITPMILDFGICKLDVSLDSLAQSDVCTTAGRMMGTPCYMAPEQVRGAVDVDARADVWALGVMLYECVSGKLPWPTESMARIVAGITAGPALRIEQAAPHLPAALTRVINRMLLRDPGARLSDLSELLTVLERLALADAPTLAHSSMPTSLPPVAPSSPQQVATMIRPRPERGTDGALKAPRRSRRGVMLGVSLAVLSAASALVLAARLHAPPNEAAAAHAVAARVAEPAPDAASPSAQTAAALSFTDVEPRPSPAPAVDAIPVAKARPPVKARPRPQSGWRDYGGRR